MFCVLIFYKTIINGTQLDIRYGVNGVNVVCTLCTRHNNNVVKRRYSTCCSRTNVCL